MKTLCEPQQVLNFNKKDLNFDICQKRFRINSLSQHPSVSRLVLPDNIGLNPELTNRLGLVY